MDGSTEECVNTLEKLTSSTMFSLLYVHSFAAVTPRYLMYPFFVSGFHTEPTTQRLFRK